MTYGELQHALLNNKTVQMNTGYTDTPVTIVQVEEYILGLDNISYCTVFWTHESFDMPQVDYIELSRLYIVD